MAIDLPPKIPPAVIQYVKDHDYLPDEFKNINKDNAYKYIRKLKSHNGYDIYQLGFDDNKNIESEYIYKNCYLLLHKSKMTRCATEDEINELAEKDPSISPSGIRPSIIKFVNKLGDAPEEFKNLNNTNAFKYIMGPQKYYHGEPLYYKGYSVYFLGFPYVYNYDKNRCQILLKKGYSLRCATEQDFNQIMTIGAYKPAPIPYDVQRYAKKYYLSNKILKEKECPIDSLIFDTYSYYKNYRIYFVYPNSTHTPDNRYKVLLHATFKSRVATKEEEQEINLLYGIGY